MSDELRLPDDLAACEARLAAMPLGASRIDRDEMLYRAGWAAGAETARLAGAQSTLSQRGARGGIFRFDRSVVAASLTSAALAASLAVAMTLQFVAPRDNGEPLVVRKTDEHDAPAAPIAKNTGTGSAPRGRSPVEFDALLTQLATAGGAPMTLHAWRLAKIDDDLRSASAQAALYVPPPKTMTVRELLEELLPGARPAPEGFGTSPFWPFRAASTGGSI